MNRFYRLLIIIQLILIGQIAKSNIEVYLIVESSFVYKKKSIVNLFSKYSSSLKTLELEKNYIQNFDCLKRSIHADSPRFIVIVGKSILKDSNGFYQDFQLSFFSHNKSSPEIIVSRLPFENYNQLSNLIDKYSTFISQSSIDTILFTYDAFNLLNDYASIISNSIVYKQNHSSNIINRLTKYQFSKNKNKLNSLVIKYMPRYIIYVGHGNSNGWETSNKLNAEFITSMPVNYFFYNFDISCNTGKISNGDGYVEKLLANKSSGSIGYIAPSIKVSYFNANQLYLCFFEEFNLNQSIGQNFLNFQKSLVKSPFKELASSYLLFGIPF